MYIALFCLILTAGAATPLPFEAQHADTGAPMLTWGDYAADSLSVNRCVSFDLEPGVHPAVPGGEWMVVWCPHPTSAPDLDPEPVATGVPAGACGAIFSWRD